MPTNLIEQVLKTIRSYEMLKPGDRVLVAVSGGPDSVFLLHALNRLKKKLSLAALYICNLDHGLRGRESEEDSLFVKDVCGKLGLKFIHKKIDLKNSKRKDISTEEEAREARYEFFKAVAKKRGAKVVATGHTLDDQAETILMRIVKGASLKGVVGILPVRDELGVRFIRPLLELEKADINRYLDQELIAYRIDRTNLEPIYFRNIVRSEIIPFLERYNPRLKRSLFHLAEHLREDLEFIKGERSKVQEGLLKQGGGRVRINLKDLVIQPRALQKEILRDMLEKSGGEVKKLTFRHWKELEGFIRHKRKGSSIDLPGGVRVSRSAAELTFYRL